jgi:hypothetical protein
MSREAHIYIFPGVHRTYEGDPKWLHSGARQEKPAEVIKFQSRYERGLDHICMRCGRTGHRASHCHLPPPKSVK